MFHIIHDKNNLLNYRLAEQELSKNKLTIQFVN